jgi:hypothetical protein
MAATGPVAAPGHDAPVATRPASRQYAPPPRPVVPLIVLADGILVESEGRTVVHIDVATGGIVLHLPGRAPLSYGVSTVGLDDASRTATILVQRAIGRRPRPTTTAHGNLRQHHLFGDGTEIDLADGGDGVDDTGHRRWDRLQSLLQGAILERCQVVARRRDSRVDAVAARVATFMSTPLVFSSAVLETPWLIDDVLRFRAAAIAVAMAETLPPPVRADAGVRALVPYLSCWRALFARDGQLSRPVSRTLALLDTPAFADVDARDVWRLRQIPLVQPLRSPRHLRVLSERQQLGGPLVDRDLRLLQLADDEAIDDAVDDVVQALRLQRLSTRQREHVLCEVLGQAEHRASDDRLAAAGAVRTLVRRRLDAVRAARRRMSRGTAVVPVATPPPIPLPVDQRLRFLSSEDDFLTEGTRMHHCVGTYFSSAVEGDGYFFHFEDEDGAATVRVSRYGVVLQAKGVCNTATASARSAATALASWGAPLTILALGDVDDPVWHGDGPALAAGERPLRTLTAVATAVASELELGKVRDVPGHVALVRSIVERALRGEAWLFFDDTDQRVRAHRLDQD